MNKSKFIKYFTYAIISIVLIFLADLFLGHCIFGLKPLIFQNFNDYMADFFNHARLAAQTNVYIPANEIEVAERGLSPLEYVIFSKISRIADFNSIPTILFEGSSFEIAKSKAIFCANYLTCAICILYFLFLFDNLKIQSKVQKYLIILAFIFSAPFIHYFERGNTVILSVFAVSYFLFNHNFIDRMGEEKRREEKRREEFSCTALSFACALKFVPFLFLPLLILKREYKKTLKVIIYSIAIFVFAFLFLNGGLSNIPLFFKNAIANLNLYKYGSGNSSDFTKLALITYLFIPFLREEWKKVGAIFLLIMALNNFYSYRLLYCYPLIILFLNKNNFTRKDILYALSFIAIISPIRLTFGFPLLWILLLSDIIPNIKAKITDLTAKKETN